MIRAPIRLGRSTCRVSLFIITTLLTGHSVQLPAQMPRSDRPTLIVQQSHTSTVGAATFSPDDELLASGSQDGSVMVWNSAGRLVSRLTELGAKVSDIAFSPNGRLVAATSGAAVAVWDVSTMALQTQFRIRDSAVPGTAAITFSNDNASLIGSGAYPFLLFKWSLSRGELEWSTPIDGVLRELVAPPSSTWAIGVDTRGRFIKVALDSGTILTTRSPQLCEYCRAVGASRGGRFVAALNDDQLFVVDTDTRQVTSPPVPKLAWNITFTPSDLLALFSFDRPQAIYYVDPRSGAASKVVEVATDTVPSVLSVNGSGTMAFGSAERRAWLVDLRNGFQAELGTSVEAPTSVQISANSRWLLTANRGVTLWDLDSGRPAHTPGPPLRAGGLPWWNATAGILSAFDEAASVIALASYKTIYTLVDGKVAWQRELEPIESVAVSRTGRYVATAEDGGRVRLWSSTTGVELWNRAGPNKPVYLTFDASEQWIAVGGDGVVVWSTTTNNRPIEFTDKNAAHPVPVAFSHQGALLAVGSGARKNGVISIHDLQSMSSRQLANTVLPRAFAFSPDDTELAVLEDTGDLAQRRFNPKRSTSESANTSLLLYDLATGAVRGRWRGDAETVAYLSRDRLLVSSEPIGAVQVLERQERILGLAGYLVPAGDQWLVAAADGQFDGSALATRQLVAWRFGRQLFPPDQFFGVFYAPGILKRIVGKPFAPGSAPMPTVSTLKLPPTAAITSTRQVTNRATIDVRSESGTTRVEQVRVYVNEKLATYGSGDSRTVLKTFEFFLAPGRNVVSVVSVDADGMESAPDRVVLTYEEPKAPMPVLHVLAVGVSKYPELAYQLPLAASDAAAIVTAFQRASGKLFREVRPSLLADGIATRDTIRAAFERIARDASPDDVVVVYLAGHGRTLGQQYYFAPVDVGFGRTDEVTAYRERGLADIFLGQYLSEIRAQKLIVILDSCESSTALTNIARNLVGRGDDPGQTKALRLLARAAGVHLIAASTDRQLAFESAKEGSGLLTAAFLQGLREAIAPGERHVSVTSLFSRIQQRVPELIEKYRPGAQQTPIVHHTGIDFPIALP